MSAIEMNQLCLCCLDEMQPGKKICNSCSESWVCDKCLPEYRKYWNTKCCICRQGVGVSESSNIRQTEPDSRLVRILFFLTGGLAFLFPIVCCYLWIKYPMGDSDTNEFILVRVLPYGFLYTLFIAYMENRLEKKIYLIFINLWPVFGHCLYIGVSFISSTYGNIFMYYGLVCSGGLVLLVITTLIMGFMELFRKIFVRNQSILPL